MKNEPILNRSIGNNKYTVSATLTKPNTWINHGSIWIYKYLLCSIYLIVNLVDKNEKDMKWNMSFLVKTVNNKNY